MKTNLKVLASVALFVLVSEAGHTGPVGPLTTFTAGTPAKASEVNGNFSAVSTAVNDNASRITTLESAVTPAGNIVLVPSTASAGNILKGTAPFIHNFGTNNTFIGVNAGNFANGNIGWNTAIGAGALQAIFTGSANTASGAFALQNNTTGSNNTASGAAALQNNTTGIGNTASGLSALEKNTTGSNNTALGSQAMQSNTTGNVNTAVGVTALFFNTTGMSNTAIGGKALFSNGTGSSNTASGLSALEQNTTGSNNTASGAFALQNNTTGGANTASGASALLSNTTGSQNTAGGVGALQSNTTGFGNTASGAFALSNNTAGSTNTASGTQALAANTTGTGNTASGASALVANTTGVQNTASGAAALFANTTGSGNIAIGIQAGFNLTTGDNNIDIGNVGVAAEANTIRIGTTGNQNFTFIAGIRGVTTVNVNAVPVVVDSAGQLGTVSSSRRVKNDIADMGTASSALMKLRPVTFHYKSDKNVKGRTLQYGLVAEEVAKVAPGLVAHSANGRIETVYYQFLAPMLLNEYQKQQRTIAAQTTRIAQLEKQSAEIAELKQQITRMAGLLGRLEEARVASAGR